MKKSALLAIAATIVVATPLLTGCATRTPYPSYVATASINGTAPSYSGATSSGILPKTFKKEAAPAGCKNCGYRY